MGKNPSAFIRNAIDKDRMDTALFASIKQAFLFLTPIFLIGACTLTIQCFPLAPVRHFVETVCNGHFYDFLGIIYDATFGFAAVYLVMVLSFIISIGKKVDNDIRVFATVSSVICYFAFLGPEALSNRTSIIAYTKMANVFSAMLIAFICTNLFYIIYEKIRGAKHNIADDATAFMRGMHSVLPMLGCLILASAAAEVISFVPGVNNFNDLIVQLLGKPFESIGATYAGGMLIMFFESVLWLLGIHGGNVFDSILTSQSSSFAFENGQIMTKSFCDTFVLMGGCGTAVCLAAAILIFSKDSRKRKLCKLSYIPVLFNINEMLVFGIPLVFNPVYVIPFILTPLISFSVAYGATVAGLVPQIINPAVQWTTPILISGYQATGSMAGSVLQLILLLIGIAVYAPFVRYDERREKRNEIRYINMLTDICKDCEADGKEYSLKDQGMALHAFEDNLYAHLMQILAKGEICLHYQPQIQDDKIVSAEALLRFRYHSGAFLYPPLVVGIAKNRGVFDALSRAVAERAVSDLKEIQRLNPDFKIAVNLSLDQIMDENFRTWLIEKVHSAALTPHTFGIEITEDANLSDADIYQRVFDRLRQAGLEIFMDDFSMGHTSITILKKNYFDYVKIDGNLIQSLENSRIQSIVASMVQLGKDLHFHVIAEYVETEKQRDILHEMGCEIFQGYLYYKAMPFPDMLEEIRKQEE